MSLQELFAEYIREAQMMQLATVANGKPWVCSVWFAYDPDRQEIYWLSGLARRHSRELMANEHVAAAIVKLHDPASPDKQGFQMEGIAYRCLGAELEHAYEVYAKRYGTPKSILEQAKQGDEKASTFWCLKPSSIVTFDTIHFADEPYRQQKL